jgi:alpha-ketoglutaric semialdehyde dehydrogenase
MTLHGSNFIGGQIVPGAGEPFHGVDPQTTASLEPEFHPATAGQVDAAVTAADAAFATYRNTTGEQRALFLERIADEIMALGDGLISRAKAETGLPEARLTGERARTVNQLKMFAQIAREGSWLDARIDTARPDRQPVPKPDLRRMLVPLGVVIVFGASNFPFAYSVAGGDTASALATGNTVVVKAHERHPGASEMVAAAISNAVAACKMPAGVFSMVHGFGPVTGMALVRHPLASAVGFTGSRTAGRALFDAAAARPEPIPVFAEMSSLNPVFLLPEALRENGPAIAEGLKNSVTLGAGQFCTKPGLVFGLDDANFGTFKQTVGKLLETVAPTTMLHAGIQTAYQRGLSRVSETQGVQPVARSKKPADPARTEGESVLVCTSTADFQRHRELAAEVFGPFSLLIAAKAMSELEEIARGLDGQLTATVHGTPRDLQSAAGLLQILERKAGRLVINGFPTGVEVCPSMTHGGPYPATTDSRFTSVGTAALLRFVRPVSFQNFPASLLPAALKNENTLTLTRLINGALSQDTVT